MSKELTEARALLKQIRQLETVRPLPSIIVELGNGSIIVTAAQDTQVLCQDAHGASIYIEYADFAEFEKRRQKIEAYAVRCIAERELVP